MSPRSARQKDVLDALVSHVLETGLSNVSLRPLAAAAGTSDRMLVYYFGDKDALIAAVLTRIAEDMLAKLEGALPDPAPRPFAELLKDLWAAAISDALRPYMVAWLEAAALSARGVEPYRAISSLIVEGFLAWASVRVEAAGGAERARLAADLLVRIDGALLMDTLGRRDIADAAILATSAPTPPAPTP